MSESGLNFWPNVNLFSTVEFGSWVRQWGNRKSDQDPALKAHQGSLDTSDLIHL